MLNVLLVDDEDIVRIMLKSIVRWENFGVGDIFDAGNGEEALHIINNEKIDIILTDIRMPVMDGLELVKKILIEKPNTICVVMTAYDEFNYARNAFRNGVFDFIVKDEINKELLEDLLQRINKEFIRKQPGIYSGHSLGVSRENIFKEFLCGNIDDRRFKELVLELKLKPITGNIVVMSLHIDNMVDIQENFTDGKFYLFQKSFINSCSYMLQNFESANIFYINESNYVIIESFSSTIGFMEILRTTSLTIEKLKETVRTSFGVTITVGVSEIGNDIIELYQQSEKSLEYYTLRGKDSIIFYRDIVLSSNKGEVAQIDICEFSNVLESKSLEGIHLYIDALGEQIIKSSIINIYDIYVVYMRLLLLTNNYISKLNISFEEIFKVNIDFYEKIRRYQTLDEISTWYKNVMDWIYDYINSRGNIHYKIKKVLEYIDKKYNQPTSLEDMAEYIEVSSNHLSKLFMKEVGQSFTDYLVLYRMNKAKQLLKSTNYQVYEISEMVGYPNSQHFCKMFRKVIGKSANEYRKLG